MNELMNDEVGCRTALAKRGLLINYEDVFRTAPATLGVFNKDMKKNGQNNCQRVQKANRKEAFSWVYNIVLRSLVIWLRGRVVQLMR